MTALNVLIYPDDHLKVVCEPVTEVNDAIRKIVDDMFDTMYQEEGIGLAAPQIGRSIRLSVIDLDVLSEHYPEYKGFRKAFINPHILEVDEESEMLTSEEGCLSIPGIHENVDRRTRIHVKWMDEDFNEHDEWIEGYLARVMQHEFDHLDGVLFTDRISPLRKQLVKNKLTAMSKGKYRAAYRTKAAQR